MTAGVAALTDGGAGAHGSDVSTLACLRLGSANGSPVSSVRREDEDAGALVSVVVLCGVAAGEFSRFDPQAAAIAPMIPTPTSAESFMGRLPSIWPAPRNPYRAFDR